MSGLFESNDACWHPGAFSKRFNLRLLIGSNETQSSLLCVNCLKCLFSATKVIVWRNYPLETLPLEDPSDKLVRIQLPQSDKKHFWHGVPFLGELKHIDMKNFRGLIETPNFVGVPNLEILDLEWCESLVEIHPSLGELKKLVRLNLRHCGKLKILPRKLETNNLTELILGNCYKITRLPEFGEHMKQLSLLNLTCTKITELSESNRFLTSLTHLNLDGCTKLLGHPHTFQNLKLLRTLSMAGCYNFFGSLKCLKEVPSSNSCSLPHSLTSLTELNLRFCGITDVSVLHHFGFLSSLVVLKLDSNPYLNVDLSPGYFSSLLRLRYLFLNKFFLSSLPKLPPCLIRLEARYMEGSLGDEEIGDLFSSLDHQGRSGTKYLGTRLTEIESGSHPCRDFVATFRGNSEIPSWFPYHLNGRDSKLSITVDIPQCSRGSEWSGIAVFLNFNCSLGQTDLSWAFKSPTDNDYVYKDWQHVIPPECNICILVLHCNDETCWQHLKDDNNQLQIQFSRTWGIIEECGWRVLCKQEMQEDSNEVGTSDSELWLPDSAVDRTLKFL